jgi:polyferredoxin
VSEEHATSGAGEDDSRRDRTLSGLAERFLNKGMIGQLVEASLYFALIYVVIGSVYAFLNATVIAHLEGLFKPNLTVFADLLALGMAIVLWPLLLLGSLVCGTATCGIV